MARQRVVDRRSAQRARRDREIESEWNCAQLHFWRREGEAEVQARPAQAHVHPTTARTVGSGHSAQSTGSTAAASSWEAQGRAAAIHPWPMPCKPCACVIIVQQITSFVSKVADAQAFPTRRSLLTSRRPSVTALHALHCCWLLLCCPSFGHAVGCIQDHRRQRQVCRSVAFFCDSLPPLTPLLHFPLFAPSQHTSACIRQSSKRHRASCSARSACRRRRRCQAGPGSCCSRESANN